jgi:hypothetical protein
MNVDVTCDPTTNPATFTFTPLSVTLNASGKVILHRTPAQATWTFQTAEVKNDTLQEFQPSVQGNGSLLQINDLFKDTVKTTYHYNVTVLSGGNSFKSTDPDIVNDPGVGRP